MDKALTTVQAQAAEVIAVESDTIESLPSAIEQLQRSLNGMRPDDLSIEFSSETDGDRRRTSFKFRAYRRADG